MRRTVGRRQDRRVSRRGFSQATTLSSTLLRSSDSSSTHPGPCSSKEPKRIGWRSALAQLWSNSPWPEQRRVRADGRGALASRRDERDQVRIFVQDLPSLLAGCETVAFESGVWFGELAALGRTPRTATVFAEAPSELLDPAASVIAGKTAAFE